MKTSKVIIIFLAQGLLLFLIFLLLIYFPSETESGQAKIFFLDVGQGDSILIRSGTGQNILIDGGPDKRAVLALSKILPFFDRTIDLVVLTHPHDDHVGGLNEIMKRYKVEQILYTGVTHTGPAFLKWLKLVRDYGVSMKIAGQVKVINLNSSERMEVIWPVRDLRSMPPENLNNSSIVLRYINDKNSFLLTGDIEESVEKEILAKISDVKADVLKLGHHGSDTSSSESFLEAVAPKLAIVSAGKNNQFGHPSERVSARLRRQGIIIIETAKEGTIGLYVREDGPERIKH